jgi:hypothetical protein
MGELQIDYNKLIWQQSVALRNVPQGTCAITLTEKDLANFVVHPIMKGAAALAIEVISARASKQGGGAASGGACCMVHVMHRASPPATDCMHSPALSGLWRVHTAAAADAATAGQGVRV